MYFGNPSPSGEKFIITSSTVVNDVRSVLFWVESVCHFAVSPELPARALLRLCLFALLFGLVRKIRVLRQFLSTSQLLSAPQLWVSFR